VVPTSKEIGDRYTVVKGELSERQHSKCAYCESVEQAKRNDVEHYRPKIQANRMPGSAATHGYWWLAWTWDNLLFSCRRNCNQSPNKLDKFPLDSGSTPLIAQQAPPGLEQPLLLDPRSEDCIPHIQFRLSGPATSRRWQPFPRDGSLRGRWTIQVCGLGSAELLDLYSRHHHNIIEPRVNELQRAFRAGPNADVHVVWDKVTRGLLQPSMPFVGLSYDALDFYFNADRRRGLGLALSMPG
jgi:uncharacterized protein (TIGR02646 family)